MTGSQVFLNSFGLNPIADCQYIHLQWVRRFLTSRLLNQRYANMPLCNTQQGYSPHSFLAGRGRNVGAVNEFRCVCPGHPAFSARRAISHNASDNLLSHTITSLFVIWPASRSAQTRRSARRHVTRATSSAAAAEFAPGVA